MTDNVERIAALETQMDSLLAKVGGIESDLKEIKDSLTKQRGFMAGVMTVLAPIWGGVIYIGHRVIESFWDAPK